MRPRTLKATITTIALCGAICPTYCETTTLSDKSMSMQKVGTEWRVEATTGDSYDRVRIDFNFLDSAVEYEILDFDVNGLAKESKAEIVTMTDLITFDIGRNASLKMSLKPKQYVNGYMSRYICPILPDDVKVTHPDSNPLRDALLPVPETAIFKMEGYGLWDPSVVKVGRTYHLFCSRWELGKETWQNSEVIRATSKSLYGPYKFEEVVLAPENHPWAKRAVHNPKIKKIGDKFLSYYLGIPTWKTGFAYADNIEGPWTVVDKATINLNNPTITTLEDGSIYAIGRFTVKDGVKDGLWDNYVRAYTAPSIDGEFTLVGDMGNRLPGDLEMEDPTIFRANGKYHFICTDWEAKATGIQKSLIYYTSEDGVNFELYSQIPFWDQYQKVPMEDGSQMDVIQIERPEAYINEDGEMEALLVGIITDRGAAEDGTLTNNHIMIRPVKKFDFK